MEENQEIIENAELNMMAAITHLETELSKIRAGKANPVMLKGISVEYYGNLTPLNQVASVSTPNAQTISIQPWEKSIIDEIEKSIIDSFKLHNFVVETNEWLHPDQSKFNKWEETRLKLISLRRY